jgi:hypothetical protein
MFRLKCAPLGNPLLFAMTSLGACGLLAMTLEAPRIKAATTMTDTTAIVIRFIAYLILRLVGLRKKSGYCP